MRNAPKEGEVQLVFCGGASMQEVVVVRRSVGALFGRRGADVSRRGRESFTSL
jgi:hypothetical protein